MNINNLSTNGSEFRLPNGRKYRGKYHIHVSQGAMVGAKHTQAPHSRLIPLNLTVAQRVNSIQRQLQAQQVSRNKIKSTTAINRMSSSSPSSGGSGGGGGGGY